MKSIHTIGIDLAKSVFQLCAFDKAGKKIILNSDNKCDTAKEV